MGWCAENATVMGMLLLAWPEAAGTEGKVCTVAALGLRRSSAAAWGEAALAAGLTGVTCPSRSLVSCRPWDHLGVYAATMLVDDVPDLQSVNHLPAVQDTARILSNAQTEHGGSAHDRTWDAWAPDAMLSAPEILSCITTITAAAHFCEELCLTVSSDTCSEFSSL